MKKKKKKKIISVVRMTKSRHKQLRVANFGGQLKYVEREKIRLLRHTGGKVVQQRGGLIKRASLVSNL